MVEFLLGKSRLSITENIKKANIKLDLAQVYHFLFIVIFFSVFFLPAIHISDSLPAIRLEDVIVIGLFFFNYVHYKIPRHIYLLFLTIYLCVVIVSILINESYLYAGNIYEIFKILKMIIIYIFFSFYLKLNNLSVVNRLFLSSFWILVIINLIQYFDLFRFNYYIEPLYANQIQLEDFTFHLSINSTARRMLGLMGNPNINSILFLFFTCYFMARHTYVKKNILSIIVSVVMVILTQSRTSFLCLIVIILIFIFKEMKVRKIIQGILLLSFIILVIWIINAQYLSLLWDTPVGKITSFTNRVDVWVLLLDMVKDKMFIGYGPFKEYFYANTLYADNEYILNLIRYGIFGLILYVALLLYPIVCALKARNHSSINNFYNLFAGMFFVVVLISGLTNAPLNEPRLQVLVLFCASLISNGKDDSV